MCWIRAGGCCVRVGGTVWNTLKEGGIEKRGGEANIKKKGGLETPYELWYETLNASQLLLVSVALVWDNANSIIVHTFG